MAVEKPLGAYAEEWLRRLALSRSLAVLPETVAANLVAAGLAKRESDESLKATAGGNAYLFERGIATKVTHAKRT